MKSSNLVIKDYEWRTINHHGSNGGFKNTYALWKKPPALKSMSWFIKKAFDLKNGKFLPSSFFNRLETEKLSQTLDKVRIVWLGQSTVLIQFPDINILLDPHLNTFAGPFYLASKKRISPLPLKIEELPAVQYVLISHNHYDHLDKKSVINIHKHYHPTFFVGLETDQIFHKWGIKRVLSFDWWQYWESKELKISFVPAVHFSKRAIDKFNDSLWGGWFIEHKKFNFKIYYAGDTAYGTHFKEISERIGAPNVALLPIGAYKPRWFMKRVHINPYEALKAFVELKGKFLIPVHWGTFNLSDEKIQDPPEKLKIEAQRMGILSEALKIIPIGGYVEFDL